MTVPPRGIESTRWRRPRGDRWAAWLTGCALAALVPGCAFFHHDDVPAAALRERILPALDFQPLPAELPSAPAGPEADRLPMPRPVEPGNAPDCTDDASASPPAAACAARGPLTLEGAIDLAFQANPTLEVMRERITQAEGGRQV